MSVQGRCSRVYLRLLLLSPGSIVILLSLQISTSYDISNRPLSESWPFASASLRPALVFAERHSCLASAVDLAEKNTPVTHSFPTGSA